MQHVIGVHNTVQINTLSPLDISNIFSTNGDGNNDVYYVRSSYVQELKAMRIYDRWGEEVFSCHSSPPLSATSTECGWDGIFRGHEAPTGVYAVFVEAVLLNGETVTKRGNVTLVR
jgi:gliding motility-associated-like protein